MSTTEKQKEIKKIVEARLSVLPSDAILSVGSYGEYTRDQIIKEVEAETKIGKKLIEIQVKYLQMLKEGVLYGNNSHN